MYVQWITKTLKPIGRSAVRGQISHSAILVKSERVGGRVKKCNRYLGTVRFKPNREAGGGLFLNQDKFLSKCKDRLIALPFSEEDRQKIISEVQNHLTGCGL